MIVYMIMYIVCTAPDSDAGAGGGPTRIMTGGIIRVGAGMVYHRRLQRV
jgi:hypothetical protein